MLLSYILRIVSNSVDICLYLLDLSQFAARQLFIRQIYLFFFSLKIVPSAAGVEKYCRAGQAQVRL